MEKREDIRKEKSAREREGKKNNEVGERWEGGGESASVSSVSTAAWKSRIWPVTSHNPPPHTHTQG